MSAASIPEFPAAELAATLDPRAALREEAAAFRERLIIRGLRLVSEIPAFLPPALLLEPEPVRAVFRSFLGFAVIEKGLHEMAVRLEWVEQTEGRGALVLHLSLEGILSEGVAAALGEAVAEACRGAGAVPAFAPEGNGRVAGTISFPPAFPVAGRKDNRVAALHDELAPPDRDPEFAFRHPFRILIVDDSEIGRKLTMRLLRNLGYEPVQASGGAEAVRLAAEQPFDLVFMDLRMPDMDGCEAMGRIRKRSAGEPPRVIALTAEISEAERRRCLEEGMADFLNKPCRPDELKAAIKALSGEPRLPQPARAPAVASRWEAADILDMKAVATLRGLPGTAKPTLLEDLYETLRRDTPTAFRRTAAALQAGDLPELRDYLHQLTGNFEVVGARRMALFCRACSEAAKREAFGELKFLFERFESNFAALCLMLEEEISKAR